jgi:nucleoside phosphorylase
VLTFITALKRIHETIKRESLFTPFHDSDEEPSTFGEPTCAYILARKSSDMPAVLPNPRLSTDVSPTSLSPGTISRPISDLPTDVSPTSLSSGTNSIQREHRDYTVGWICALPIELTAAIAMLDTRHQPLSKHAKEKNAYAVGSIGYHNVVITCLPAGMIGNNSAASVATEMEYSFPNISIRLMVGIGGGVPSTEHDIRLGDVVVSRPGPHDGGVVQYDFGKMIKGGVFEKTGSLASPPPALLSAVSHLEALNNNDGSKISTFLEAFNTENLKSKFEYPSADRDRLFASDYDHVQEQATCVNCDKSRLVNRPPRKTLPIVHHGTIASGNKVMKDAKSRDELGRKLGALCFEMEAAGLMNTFPCIVIRGICDYADTHKNKEWQGYAAATAAAYAKELLINIPPSQIN